ncbi:AsmA family protein [Caldimonas sp. KR1-144]|uniref:AsmA family protein n=1 Tax=Caldimonas sp. KR1-144 TaxID=3400911 RepID=UPI003BFE2D6A
MAEVGRRARWLPWAAAVPLLLIAALLLAEWSGWRFLRASVEQRLSDAVGAPVRIDEGFELHLLRAQPRVAIGRLQVDSRREFGVPHLLLATALEISTGWGDLWRWRGGEQLVLREVSARTLGAQLVRLEDGQANWRPAGAAPAPPPDEAPPPLPRVGRMAVPDGLIELDDRPLRTKLRIALSAVDGAAGTPAFRAQVTGHYRAMPLRLGAVFSPAPHDAQQVLLRLDGEAGRSRLRFDGALAPLAAARTLQGEVRVEGPSLAAIGVPLGLTLPTTPPFDIAGRLSREGQRWRFDARRAVIGSSQLAGEFVFERRAQRPHLGGTLRGKRLAFADLGPAVGTGARPPQAPRERVLPARRFDIPRLRAMDADVAVDVDQLDFGSAALAPLGEVKARVRLADGVLWIQDLRAGLGKGLLSGRTRLDGRGDPALWSADLAVQGIAIEDWVRGVRRAPRRAPANGVAAPPPPYVTGELVAAINVSGRGRSTAELLASMDGKARLQLRNGTLSHLVTELAGVDIAESLGVAVKGDEPLPLRCARVDLQIRDGIATPTVAMLDNRDSSVRVDGRIDLRDESLALRATVRPKDVSLLSLRSPLVVSGHLAQPRVGVEGGRLVPRVLAALALGFIAPPAAVLPLVDPGAPAPAPCG